MHTTHPTDADTDPDLALRGWGPTGFRCVCPDLAVSLKNEAGPGHTPGQGRQVRGAEQAAALLPAPTAPCQHPGQSWGTSSPSHSPGRDPPLDAVVLTGPQRHPSRPSSVTPQPKETQILPRAQGPVCPHPLLQPRTRLLGAAVETHPSDRGSPTDRMHHSHALQCPHLRCSAQCHAVASQTQTRSSPQNWPGFQSRGHQSHGRPQKVPD